MSNIVEENANQVVSKNYQDYAKYVLETRALPAVSDGLKLVQRRIIYGASRLPQKMMKTAALAGEIMKLHPHGDCSGQIYTMTYPGRSQKIFNIRGNHGGPSWGASAPRYTECYLNEIGRFNYCQFLEYAEYEEGELGVPEPKALPCLIPYGIVEGSEGMGVGISSDLMPLNLIDLIHCYKKYISEGVFDSSIVKPDPGPFLINVDDKNYLAQAVNDSRGWISVIPIIKRESEAKISVGTIPKGSIEKVIEKLGWWISEGCVEFTNESTAENRYTFEIVDSKKGEITLDKLIDKIERAGRLNNTYTRCMVDDDKSAVYCSLEYVMKKSLATLNRAIDKWHASELSKVQKKLELYRVLALAKSLRLFDDISKISTGDLVSRLIDKCQSDEDIAREIVKKPISYLTRDHDDEEKELREWLNNLQNHDRKKYLLDLYDKFESMIAPDFNSKQHAIPKSDQLINPKIRLNNDHSVEIYKDRRRGYNLNSKVFLVGRSGWLYIRYFNSPTRAIIDFTDISEPIVGMSTDQYDYLEVQTQWDKKGISFRLESLDREKSLVTLDDGEEVVNAVGWDKNAPERVTRNILTKRSKTRWY